MKKDFSSVTVPFANHAVEGVIMGGQPTDENLQQAKVSGITTVVNLRAAGEVAEYATEQSKATELGMKYVHIPIDGKTGDGLNEANARKLASLLETDKPMLLHCKSGQRVGALLAFKAIHVDGASAADALEVAKRYGLSNPELTEVVSSLIAKAAK